MYPEFWPRGDKVNNTSFVLALCAIISEGVLELVKTQKEVMTNQSSVQIERLKIDIDDKIEEAKGEELRDEIKRKVVQYKPSSNIRAGPRIDTSVSSTSKAPIATQEQSAGNLPAHSIGSSSVEVINPVVNLSNARSNEKIDAEPVKVILGLAIAEIIKNTHKGMEGSFSDHIEGIAPVEKDGTVTKESDTPVILRLPNDVLSFAESIELSEMPMSSVSQVQRESASSEVMDFLTQSEESINIEPVDASVLEQINKNRVRFQVPEEQENIFHNPKKPKESTEYMNQAEKDNACAYGYTDVKTEEIGYTEGNVTYGYDTSASERD